MQELHEDFEYEILHIHMQELHTGFEYEQYGKQNVGKLQCRMQN